MFSNQVFSALDVHGCDARCCKTTPKNEVALCHSVTTKTALKHIHTVMFYLIKRVGIKASYADVDLLAIYMYITNKIKISLIKYLTILGCLQLVRV